MNMVKKTVGLVAAVAAVGALGAGSVLAAADAIEIAWMEQGELTTASVCVSDGTAQGVSTAEAVQVLQDVQDGTLPEGEMITIAREDENGNLLVSHDGGRIWETVTAAVAE